MFRSLIILWNLICKKFFIITNSKRISIDRVTRVLLHDIYSIHNSKYNANGIALRRTVLPVLHFIREFWKFLIKHRVVVNCSTYSVLDREIGHGCVRWMRVDWDLSTRRDGRVSFSATGKQSVSDKTKVCWLKISWLRIVLH